MNNEPTSRNSQTDWQCLDAMSDEDINLSDCSEITLEMFARAIVRRGLPTSKGKAQVKIHINSNVSEWFKAQGRGYQTQSNQSLKRTCKHIKKLDNHWQLVVVLAMT